MTKAQQIYNFLSNNTIYSGELEYTTDENTLTIYWDTWSDWDTCDVSSQSYEFQEIEKAIGEAEEEAPFEVSQSFAYGVLQILAIGDWLN